MMKKLMAIIVVAAMAVSLCACKTEDAADKKTSAAQTEDKGTASTTKSDSETATENESDPNVLDKDYELLDEFISLVCTYSDPPALEGEAYQQYFKEEYDKWRNGEAYGYITKDSDGQLVIFDCASEYVGTWQDTNSGRCYMEISSADGVLFNIDINWGSSAQENVHWSFYGQYDEIAAGIHYSGSRVDEFYTDDGELIESAVYNDGEGVIRKSDDGIIYWFDYVDQMGENCAFEIAE